VSFNLSSTGCFSQGSADEWGLTPEQLALHNFMQRNKEKVAISAVVTVNSYKTTANFAHALWIGATVRHLRVCYVIHIFV
jgi:hypothetical protein